MMNNLQIYLCGKMSGLSFQEMNSWRELLSVKFKSVASDINVKVKVINPVDYFNFEEKTLSE